VVRIGEAANVPIDLLRTLVDFSTTRSVSGTAAHRRLSQPAVSLQLKKLQSVLGWVLFTKEPSGYQFTPLGERVVQQARKILEAYDRLMLLTFASEGDKRIRVGVPPTYIERFATGVAQKSICGDIVVTCEYSEVLRQMLDQGDLDLALLVNWPGHFSRTLAEWPERLVWGKAPGFTLNPGAPVPVIGKIGNAVTTLALNVLEQNGLLARVSFSSSDFHAMKTAARAGLGLLAVPLFALDDTIVEGRDYYLPPFPTVVSGVYAQQPIEKSDAYNALIDIMVGLAANRAVDHVKNSAAIQR
jgi:DNA-binding transcriptional LysR family regulator